MLVGRLQSFAEMTGYCLQTLGSACTYAPRATFRWRSIVREMWIIGVQSLPLVSFFLLLVGMVSALQAGIQMKEYGQEHFLGRLVGMGMVRELGPWMTSFVLIARNGSAMAAEIGTMCVSEEVAALRIMSIHPNDFIVMPRLIAFVVMGPVLTVFGTIVGILGGMIVTTGQFDVPIYTFMEELYRGMEPPLAIYWTVFKAIIFSITAATIACSFGLRTEGGALGVGKASRNAVVYSLTFVVFFNFILASLYQVVSSFAREVTV